MAKRIDKRWKLLAPGTFASKKITFASTEEVEASSGVASEFMSTVFDLDPDDYAISDESDIFDFTPFDERTDDDVWARIERAYGLTKADVGSGRLVRIFKAISDRRSTQ